MWTDDIVTLFQEANVGVLNASTGTGIFVSTKANVPLAPSGAATVTIVETPGSGPERTQNSVIRPAYIRPSAQILVRAATSKIAKGKAYECYNALVGIRNALVYREPQTFQLSGWYREINPLQEPFDLGVDDRKEIRYAFNVTAVRRP
jgi:hypothetical protein